MPLDQNPHQTVTWLFNICVLVSCAPNATILLVYIAAKIKMSFIWKDDFFCTKSASSVSRSQAIFPSAVQAYTKPYSFGGRIKIIICQIRHELSVTIHEKKSLDGGLNIRDEGNPQTFTNSYGAFKALKSTTTSWKMICLFLDLLKTFDSFELISCITYVKHTQAVSQVI